MSMRGRRRPGFKMNPRVFDLDDPLADKPAVPTTPPQSGSSGHSVSARKQSLLKELDSLSSPSLSSLHSTTSWSDSLVVGGKKLDNEWTMNINGKDIPCETTDIKVKASLGRGKFGSVDLVDVKGLTMAKKTMDMVHIDEGSRKYMVQELDILYGTLKSDFIVNFYAAFFWEWELIILMEYCACGSLYEIYSTKLQCGFPEETLTHIAYQTVLCLSYLESIGIIHRDLKPENILLSSDGYVKLCDFNVAGKQILEQNKTVIGTCVYLAPERCAGKGDSYDARVDTWSLGISLVELAIAKKAYDFSHLGSVFLSICNDPAPTIPASKNISLPFNEFVALCSHKEKSDRPFPKDLKDHALFKGFDLQMSYEVLKNWIKENNIEKTVRM